jgi:hypothetical protein
MDRDENGIIFQKNRYTNQALLSKRSDTLYRIFHSSHISGRFSILAFSKYFY